MKRNKELQKLLFNSEQTKKINLFFSTKEAGEDYDPQEQKYDYTALNPITIKGIVTELSPEKLVYKGYGESKVGSVEIMTDSKYKEWFKNCIAIEIEGVSYTTYKDAVGSSSIVQDITLNIIRVACERV